MTANYEIRHTNSTWYVYRNNQLFAGFTRKKDAKEAIENYQKWDALR